MSKTAAIGTKECIEIEGVYANQDQSDTTKGKLGDKEAHACGFRWPAPSGSRIQCSPM
jgi:hypothetical protein